MLKRLWDTENKKIVWLRDGKKAYQVFTDGDKLYVYHAGQRMEYNPSTSEAPAEEYWPTWAELVDEEVGYYDTNVPTNMYNWNKGGDVEYAFKNWSTVLQMWTIEEGETPEYTGDTPTKAATAQYTYTFSWWKPTVWPIYKTTNYAAQFDKTVNEYDLTIAVNDDTMGSVDVAFVEWQPYGTAISAEANVLTIGEWESKTVVTATAETGYVFKSWGTLPSSVSGDATITATFEAAPIEE